MDALPKPATSSPPVSQKLKVGVIVASFILPLVGIIAGLMYLKSEDPEKRKVARPWLFIGFGCFLVYGAGFCGKLLSSQQPVCYNKANVAVQC